MRKIAVALFLLLLTQIGIPVFAVRNNQVYCQNNNAQHSYQYNEREDEHGRIIREYRSGKKMSGRAYMHALLADLGMGKNFIAALTDEKIDMYANSEIITSITTYTRKDQSGNIEIVDEDTVREGIISSYKFDPPAMDDFDGGYGSSDLKYSNQVSDSYMRLTFIVTYKGNAVYHFSIDAEWLTTPDDDERFYEAIGICASYITVMNNTRTGWYSYLETHELMYDDNEDKYNRYTITLLGDNNGDGTEDHISNYVDGNWNGSGAIFSFPKNVFRLWPLTDERIKTYSEFAAHYEFEGIIAQPTQTTNFSALASYDHCIVKPKVTPSLEFSNQCNGALSFAIEEEHYVFPVELPEVITYSP